jgi:dTMP kinase
MKPVRFITFEGIDGAGKSSHIDALANWLRSRGLQVLVTREPGGTPLAETLREMVLHQPMDSLTEALLVFAARRDHLQRVIEPALAAGQVVLCDRFTDASFAYQGGGRRFDLAVLAQLEDWVQTGRQPDRFEVQDLAFFERVIAGYEGRCAADPQRFVCIDARPARDRVWEQVEAALQGLAW